MHARVALAVAFVAASSISAQTSFPMITHVSPVAVQRGTEVEVTVDGQMNFAGVHKVLVDGRGVTGKPVATMPAKDAKSTTRSTKITFKVAMDAELGVREFRLASTLGISSLGQLVIVDDPVVQETADNNSTEKAQRIPSRSVVCGRIEALEDIDCFRFAAKQGQVFTFEVLCARIQDKIHDLQKHADPLIAILDASGRELAASDDGTYADPFLTYTIPKDGDYIVQVRDARYDGDPRWVYALSVTDQPRVSHVFPLAGNPGQAIDLEPVGSARLIAEKVRFTFPNELGIQSVPLPIGQGTTNSVTMIVTPLPIVSEQEPNDAASSATKFTVPAGINGRIGKRRDLDHYVFKASKGKAVRFEVFARRFGTNLTSRLDAVLDVLSPAGAVLASNDDANGKDPALVFTPTTDGDHIVRIRDLNNKGGDGFAYFLEADWARPDFTLKCDPSKAMIGPGSRTAWFVQVARTNGFTGPVKVEVAGLPKGVTVNPLTIPAAMTQGLLVVSAAADAPLDASIVEITGAAELDIDGKRQPVTKRATPVEEIYSPGGGRARFDVKMQAVAVTGPSDILDVQVKPERIVLKPGEEVRIDVTIKRRADYDKPVFLDIPLRHLNQVYGTPLPAGVTIVEGKSKTLLGIGTTGHIVLKADASAAPIDDIPICIQAHVSINFVVKMSYASPAILVSVKK